MALVAKKSADNFEIAPAGTFVGRCVWLIDLGTQLTTFQGKEKKQQKVLIGFELPTELMADGRPFLVSQRYTNILNEKSNLQKMLESWRGSKFTEQEAEAFDLTKLIGLPCMISIIHNVSGDKTYANISSVAKLMKGMECPKQINESIVFAIEEVNTAKYDKLPEWVQGIVKSSQEVLNGGTPFESENPADGLDGPVF